MMTIIIMQHEASYGLSRGCEHEREREDAGQ
jgi:hypothetical protein